MLFLRFLIGGSVVCVFASLADVLRPKTFAGIFGAAPSVALATLALTVSGDGKAFAAEEARAMIAGSVCFSLYAFLCLQLIARYQWSVLHASFLALVGWAGLAVTFWFLFLR